MLEDALRQRFFLIPFFTVRNPVDQWISLNRLIMYRQGARPVLRSFLYGYLQFAELARTTGYIRFEDFTSRPDDSLKLLCNGLKIPFDSGYTNKWGNYHTITGDNTSQLGTRRTDDANITILGRQALERDVLEEFRRYDEYHEALAVLGYADS